ncbi:MAG: exodeoxyribonuclease VII small subunit [Bacteroidales bacterium]|nr:exodeoxyribonuclease VII small subunit [Bacteroidales bacterium]
MAENISYKDAIEEIESILQQVESGELDVDQLTDKVKRVSALLEICNKKLKTTEKEVEKIIKEMQEGE